MAFSSLTIPKARPAPSAPPARASNALSVNTWRKSCARRAPKAQRTAYSCRRRSPRASNKPATFPQAMRNTRVTAPSNGKRSSRPSRFRNAVSGWTVAVMPSKSWVFCACLAAIAVISAWAWVRVELSRNRPATLQ